MVILTSLEERRRRSRNVVLASFILLFVIWSIKLAYPQSTILSAYQNRHPPNPKTVAPAAPKLGTINPNANKWKTEKPGQVVGNTADTFNGTLTTKAAIIIETRFHTSLIPLILHFSSVLGPTWPIRIYTSPESVGHFATSAALARFVRAGTIQIHMLPQTVLFTNADSVNAFMTMPWIWEDLAPAEHILVFQSDSMLCANAARSVDDFFEYDMVGAAMNKEKKGYTGGLSLRKRSTILKVLENWDWETTKKDGDRFEDQWYWNRMKELEAYDSPEADPEADLATPIEGAINLPSTEVSRTFSVESIDYPHPLAVYQTHKWSKNQLKKLDAWCPEYKLCSEESIVD